jgi:hypothetical protein
LTKKLRDLYEIHKGKDIYIIGTGASFRVFPKDFFEDKITIGLNLAWQLMPVNYVITMVPHLNFPEFTGGNRPQAIWITKRDKYHAHANEELKKFADQNYYYFKTDGQLSVTHIDEPSEAGRLLEWVKSPNDEYLYLWTSISQTAVNLAANMGAKNIILVGCDNCALLENHHAQDQHTLWKGADPNDRYMQYYLGLREVRTALKDRGINVLSLNPFLKLDDPEMDFQFLCEEIEKPTYIENKDIYNGVSLKQYNLRYISMTRVLIKRNFTYILKAVLDKLSVKKI